MNPFIYMTFATVGIASLVACGGSPKPVAQTPTTTTTSTSSNPDDASRKPAGSHLTVSGDIYRLCHLEVGDDTQAAPKFAFDESLITATDARVLDKIRVASRRGRSPVAT